MTLSLLINSFSIHEWMKDNILLTFVIFFGGILLVNLLGWAIIYIVRLPKYNKFMTYTTLRSGMTREQVKNHFHGLKIKQINPCFWQIKCKQKTGITETTIYTLKLIFTQDGRLYNLETSSTTKKWYMVYR